MRYSRKCSVMAMLLTTGKLFQKQDLYIKIIYCVWYNKLMHKIPQNE
jgi:hypothetical protein